MPIPTVMIDGKKRQCYELCQLWRAWQQGKKIVAELGDGSPIEAVGRPHNWVCEVHSTRGVEYRRSDEIVFCTPLEEDG